MREARGAIAKARGEEQVNKKMAELIARIQASAARLGRALELLEKAGNGGERRAGTRLLRREAWLLARLAMKLWVGTWRR